jgi:CRISPR-associated protein (TIGR02710 family)
MSAPGRVLLLTVGTGTAEELDATVMKPFAKSIRKGEWAKVVLFPSQATEENAFLLKDAHPGVAVEVRALRKVGAEEDVDACFAHFDQEIGRLKEAGYAGEEMTADFTRGTKAMSAGLALAAVAQGIGTLRYVGATKRDGRGMAVPGFEVPAETSAGSVLERQLLLRGVDYLRAGDFRAASRLFPGWPKIQYSGPRAVEIRWLCWLAEFWGAWDSFDYKRAKELSADSRRPKGGAGWVAEMLPSQDQLEFIAQLARSEPKEWAGKANGCRWLAADLLGNAGRRLKEGQTEEALVRAYRVLELIGQLRLFAHGLDSEDIDREHKVVGRWVREQAEPPREDSRGRCAIGREKVASLLRALGDPLAPRLNNLDWLGEFQPQLRNRSILIHGFKSRTREKQAEITELLRRLEEFFVEEDAGNGKRLEAARFAFLVK